MMCTQRDHLFLTNSMPISWQANMRNVENSVDELVFETQACHVSVRNTLTKFSMLSNKQVSPNHPITTRALPVSISLLVYAIIANQHCKRYCSLITLRVRSLWRIGFTKMMRLLPRKPRRLLQTRILGMHVCMYVFVCVRKACTLTCQRLHDCPTYTHVFLGMRVKTYAIYIYIYICVYMCIHIHIHT